MPTPTNPTAGISGDVLIARRRRGVCVACGVTPMIAINPSADTPTVCDGCLTRLPPRRRFNPKAEQEQGIANLDRLLAGLPLAPAAVTRIKSPLCVYQTHCGAMAERGPGIRSDDTINHEIRCTRCGRTGTQSRRA